MGTSVSCKLEVRFSMPFSAGAGKYLAVLCLSVECETISRGIYVICIDLNAISTCDLNICACVCEGVQETLALKSMGENFYHQTRDYPADIDTRDSLVNAADVTDVS